MPAPRSTPQPGRPAPDPASPTRRRIGAALAVTTCIVASAMIPPTAQAQVPGPAPEPTRATTHGAPAVDRTDLGGTTTRPATPAHATRGRADPGWVLPVRSTEVLAAFRDPVVRWGSGHRGVDLATEVGADVVAPADGVVTFAGWVVSRGVVTTAHPGGVLSSVEPVVPDVAVGTVVRAGDHLATVADGRSHCAQPCAHWGVRVDGGYVDPLGLVEGSGPVVLLAIPVG